MIMREGWFIMREGWLINRRYKEKRVEDTGRMCL